MAKYWVDDIDPNPGDHVLLHLVDLSKTYLDVDGFVIPWWLVAKYEMVRRDIKNLNAELLALRDHQEVAS